MKVADRICHAEVNSNRERSRNFMEKTKKKRKNDNNELLALAKYKNSYAMQFCNGEKKKWSRRDHLPIVSISLLVLIPHAPDVHFYRVALSFLVIHFDTWKYKQISMRSLKLNTKMDLSIASARWHRKLERCSHQLVIQYVEYLPLI